MATRRIRGTLALILAAFASSALALDFRSLADAAPAYDAPSTKSKPVSVVLAGTPVEQIVTLEGWAKVRDLKGELIWIERKFLADKRMVIVRSERAQVRAAADDKSALVFEAERDVVLELMEAAPGGWARVRHRDGQAGFVKAPQVWGL
jgi:SH3-like domain-containing protein